MNDILPENQTENTVQKPTKEVPKWVSILFVFVTLVLVGGCALFLYLTGGFEALKSEGAMTEYLNSYGPMAKLIFWILQFISVIIAPIPGNITTLVGGVLFGVWDGTWISVTAIWVGSFVVFMLARLIGQSFVQKFVSPKVSNKYLQMITKKRDAFIFLTLLFPFFPDDAICMLAGLTDISIPKYIFILIVSKPWGLVVSSAMGAWIKVMPVWLIVILCILFVAIFVLGLIFGEKIEDFLTKIIEKIISVFKKKK